MFVIQRTLRALGHANFWTRGTHILYKNFHKTTINGVKMYMEHENIYAYNIMENKGYVSNISNTIRAQTSLSEDKFNQLIEEDWSKKSPKEIFEYFPLFGDYCSERKICISNKIFDNYIDNLTDNIRHATDQELASIFYSFKKWPETESIRTRNFIEVWVALDDICFSRLNSWSFDQMLSFLSLFYMLNVTRVSEYSKKVLQKLASKYKQLSPAQLVQAMFFIGVYRKQPFDMHNLEVYLSTNFEDFSIDELAIISMGFFKSKTPIRNLDIIGKMIDKIIANPKDIHEVSLAALLKIIRYSMKISDDDRIYRLLDALQFEVPRLSSMCNTHVALLGTATLTLHEDCLTTIGNKVINCMAEMRLKDLERLVLTYATFNFIPPTKQCLFQKVTEELRCPERQPEIDTFGRSYISCLEYLGHLGIYHSDLMNKALSPDFLQRTYGKHYYLYGRNVLAVHNTAKIFHGDKDINRLSDRHAIVLAKKYTDFVPNLEYKKQYNVSERLFLEVQNVLEEIRGGRDYVVGDHILSHHQRGDLIICNDLEGKPLPVINTFTEETFGLLRRPPDKNIWIVLIIAGRNAIIRNTGLPTGHFQAKVRELKALGYYPALVSWSIYSKLETNGGKARYILGLIENATSKTKNSKQ